MKRESVISALRAVANAHGGVVRLGRGQFRVMEELAAEGIDDRHAVRKALADMASSGTAIRVIPGVYIVPDARGRVSATAAAPQIATGNAYVSLRSAAAAHGFAPTPTVVSVVTDRQSRHSVIDMHELGATAYYHWAKPEHLFGYRAQDLPDGFRAPVAGAEKTLVDLVWFAGALDAPGVDELIAIWEQAAADGMVKGAELIGHVRRIGHARLAQRVGYLMERCGIAGWDQLHRMHGHEHRSIPLVPGAIGIVAASRAWEIE